MNYVHMGNPQLARPGYPTRTGDHADMLRGMADAKRVTGKPRRHSVGGDRWTFPTQRLHPYAEMVYYNEG